MPLQTGHLYDFGEFRLDIAEKVLLRDGKIVAVTPKVFDTLQILVEHAGHLIEKDELMRLIWQERFVEESNLTFNIKMLRRALGDVATKPRFIETVHRRGYRFVAEVSEGIVKETSPYVTKPAISQPVKRNSAGLKFKRFLLPAGAILCIGVIASGFWYARSSNLEANAPVLSASLSLEKLSTNGKVRLAVISPNGTNVAYTNGIDGSDKQSVWLRQLESSNNIQIIPPSDDFYYGLAFSPDGNFLYLSRRQRNIEGQADIFRVSIFGGIPVKIINEVQGWISVSPDGSQISFVRCFYREDEYCSLWIADAADGKNERKLLSRPRPFRIGDNKIAPDGRTIAFAVGQSETGANEFGLAEVDIESGVEREMTAEKFFNIKSLVWLPNQSGLLMTALKYPDTNYRIWEIPDTTGGVSPLTKDPEDYSAVSLDKDAGRLVATQVKADFRLNLYQADDFTRTPRALADAMNVVFAPNGKIIFSSAKTGNYEIWSINLDGTDERQLTNDPADDLASVVSPDNYSVFFGSNRTGTFHVWRMNADGSNQTRITNTEGGFPLSVSPDGKWLYYHSALQETLRRVSTAGGEEQLVLDKKNRLYAISPDGSLATFPEKQGAGEILTVVLIANGQAVKTFRIGDERARILQLAWSHDGKNLFYILAKHDNENNVLWMQSLGGETPKQIADLGDEQIAERCGFALSPDEKSFAVAQGGWKHDAVLFKGLR